MLAPLPVAAQQFPASEGEDGDEAAEVTPPATDTKDIDKSYKPLPKSTFANHISLQMLNKVTARIQKVDGPIGAVMRFGNLEILPRRCWKSSPEEKPENAALIEVWELKPGEGPERIFLGWMFSSSPGLSSLENPVYDITVLACENVESPAE